MAVMKAAATLAVVILLLATLPIVNAEDQVPAVVNVLHPGYYDQPSQFLAYKMPMDNDVPLFPPIYEDGYDIRQDPFAPPIQTMSAPSGEICKHWCEHIRSCRAYYFHSVTSLCSLIGHVYPIMEEYSCSDSSGSAPVDPVMVKSHEIIYTDVALNKHVEMSSVLDPEPADANGQQVSYGGDRLVDGHYNADWGQPDFSLASTQKQDQPWLIIHLDQVFLVYAVNIWNAMYAKGDYAHFSTSDAVASVALINTDLDAPRSVCATKIDLFNERDTLLVCSRPRVGRFMKFMLNGDGATLNLQEIEVYASYFYRPDGDAALAAIINENQAEDEIKAWNQPYSITDYLYQENLPEFSEMTFCFWYGGDSLENIQKEGRTDMHLVSISAGSQHNSMLFKYSPSLKTELFSWKTSATELVNQRPNVWLEAHRHCVSTKLGGNTKWYVSNEAGEMELMSEIEAVGESLEAGGSLVLMQDQDSRLGGFNPAETAVGIIADFGLWNSELTEEQIRALTSADKGNVANMDTLQIRSDQGSKIFSC